MSTSSAVSGTKTRDWDGILRWGILLYLAVAAANATIRYWLRVPTGGHAWTTGDWLIHYGAGFVRRGLTGSLTFLLSDLTSLNITLVAALTQTAVYGAMLAAVFFMISRLRMSAPVVMIAVSPVFLLMPFFSLKLAMSKELVGFLGLALMALMAFGGRAWMFWCGVVVLALSGFAHEINAFLVADALALLAVLWIARRITRRSAMIAAVVLVLSSLGALATAAAFPGHGMSAEICGQIVARGGWDVFCNEMEPAWWLEKSTRFGIDFTWQVNVATGVWPWFILGYILSMVPFAMFRLRGDVQGRRSLWLFLAAAAALVVFAPLFVVASDWGRWIAMHVFGLAMLTFAALRTGLIEPRVTTVHPVFLLYGAVWAMTDFGESLSPGLLTKGWRVVTRAVEVLSGLIA